MPKLPANTVKRPVFDNPLRPTVPLELVDNKLTVQDCAPVGRATEPARVDVDNVSAETLRGDDLDSRNDGGSVELAAAKLAQDPLCHRLSVRFTDPQWAALQQMCRRRRIDTGENVTVAEMVRELLVNFCERTPM
jgi:hypothetical protein